MGRMLVLLAIGAAVGSAATYLAVHERSEPLTALIEAATGDAENGTALRGRRDPLAPDFGAEPPSVADLAALYQLAARADDTATLQTLTERIAALPETEQRRVALEALFARYAEIDARAALDAATDLNPRYFTRLLETLARTDPDVALSEALAIGDRNLRYASAQQVVSRWAAENPRAALVEAEAVQDPLLRSELVRTALASWASHDPQTALGYLASTNLARNLRDPIEYSAVTALADRDPYAAVAYFDALPPGPQRQQIAQMIARSYAGKDPDGALAWARDLRPSQPEVLAMVFGVMARTDPERALERALMLPPGERLQTVRSVVMTAANTADDAQAAALAEHVLALENSMERRMTLQMFFMSWGARSPEAATEWLLANPARTDASILNQIGQQFGKMNPARAAEYLSRLPSDTRGDWIGAVAQGYASSDPQAALVWISQFRGEPSYGAAAAAIAQTLAQYDPQAAISLLANIDTRTSEGQSAAMMVAQQWALREPRAAAEWALSYPDPSTRPLMLASTTQMWAGTDPQASRAWALNLPPGANRDAALQALVPAVAQSGPLDQAMLKAFSAPAIRQRAVVAAIFPVALRDPAEARRLIDTELTDPEFRVQAERMLAASEQRPGTRPPVGMRINPYMTPGLVAPAGGPVVIAPNSGAVQAIRAIPSPE